MAFIRAVLVVCAVTFTDASRVKVKAHLDFTGGAKCDEAAIKEVCICEKRHKGSQCVACKDKDKWGHGCELSCPTRCSGNCDFSGNCIPEDPCPTNCKRNGRMDKPTSESLCINAEGNCQACLPGFHGLMCKEECPQNCEPSSVEGPCARAGTCYNCKTGFFGEQCDKKCPDTCPKKQCTQRDGTDEKGHPVPAGSCTVKCPVGFWGLDCKEKCPANCDKQGCLSLGEGICIGCRKGFWGDKCTNQCSSHCIGGSCQKADGFCEAGCESGWYGGDCQKQCPEFSVGPCDRDTGLPTACDATHYPGLDQTGTGVCKECSKNCVGQKCGDDGACSEGCVEGFFGPVCEKPCPDNCVGGCDQTGQCKACAPGKTGAFCKEPCHYRCETCSQFHKKTTKPGNEPTDCLSCPADDASELASEKVPAECVCIKAAHRNDANAKCTCENPSDDYMEAIFLQEEDKNYKKCDTKCKEEYQGKALRSVYGKNIHKCITVDLYNSVVVAFTPAVNPVPPKLADGGCKENEYPIEVHGQSGPTCLREDFVQHIMGVKKFG